MSNPSLALARGHSTDFKQTYEEDIVESSYFYTNPNVMLDDLPEEAIILGSNIVGSTGIATANGTGRPVGINIMATNLHADERTAGCQVILVRKVAFAEGTRFMLRLYGTLAIVAGSGNAGASGKKIGDSYTMTLAEEGTRIETKTGVASNDNDFENAPCFFNIPDLDNAYGVILDGACNGALPSNAINFCHEFTT